ncbi:hypothetical protein DFH09DRAFT_1183640 [Mycena vulgaris]|nr:hypothetical protein DFH09DRAFT_1183640 [Mycena vulgaris]
MARKTVILTADERAICRVRYRQVATYMDPGLHPMTPNDRIIQAIAGHWKNGEELEHGPEHSDLLFPFGNKRAVSRHVNKGSSETEAADREIAWAWVDQQPQQNRAQILTLLGLADKGGVDEPDSDAEVKDEEDSIKQEAAEASVGTKRKREDDADPEEDSKADVLSKRPRAGVPTPTDIKQESEGTAIKTEA